LGDLLKKSQIHLGVMGGRLDRSMAQDGRDIFEPDILTQHLARGCMSEYMGTANRRLNTGTLQGSPCDMGDRMSGLLAIKRFERSHGAKKDMVTLYRWPPCIQIGQKGITDILRKR
jgi:hypothetical protein